MEEQKDLIVQGNTDLSLFFEDADRQLQLSKEGESSGYASSFIRAQSTTAQDRRQFPNGVGSLEIRFSRDDIIYPRVAAVFPVDVIGTSGGRSKDNPTPRKWLVDYNDTANITKYGYTWCQSTNGVQPDAVTYNQSVEPIHGRELVHPDANGRTVVPVRAGYKSEKIRDIDTTIKITDETFCEDCVLWQSWWAADAPEGSSATLQAPCKLNPAGVFYLVGADTYDLFGPDRRSIAQVPMYGQSTRVMFGKKNDAEYQKEVGIFAPMHDMIKAKPVDNVPANAVYLVEDEQQAVIYFPFLLGALIKTEPKGHSKHPFLYNPAASVRESLRTTTGDIIDRLATAIKNAASTMLTKIGVVSNYEIELQQIEKLLKATVVLSFVPKTMELYAEYKEVTAEYDRVEDGQKVGRRKLTTPIDPRNFSPRDSEEEAPFQQQQTATPNPVSPAPTPEELAQALQAIQNAGQNFLAADEDDDTETEEFFNSESSNIWGD